MVEPIDTIFALSSGAPPSAIAVIRISGPAAFDSVSALAGRLPAPRRPSLAKLFDPIHGGLLDEALLLLFPSGGSVTGEDLAELHLHGGKAVIRAIERALEAIPTLRSAQPGEFTRRAFHNGRIDLNEAEGLSDLLSAETEHQRRAAANMMGGVFSLAIEGWRLELLRISALTEAELDLSDEDDVAEQSNHVISNACLNLASEIDSVLQFPTAEKLRDGLRVVLGGPPNSGKSTLLNMFVSRDAAIVSDIAGTTRDVIDVPISFGGIPFIFTDTAGIREQSSDSIEMIGMARAHEAFANADIIVWLGPEGAGPEHPQLIEAETKSDIASGPIKTKRSFFISGATGLGVPGLIDDIVDRAKTMLPKADGYAVNVRQRELLAQIANFLNEASSNDDWLIVAECLRQARLGLDALTGRTHTEDLLDTLFGTFCVGK